MTSDEIKKQVSMKSVIEKYGIKVTRSNKCYCPFHKEKTPSMVIYKDSYHCFGCGENGDIFSFTMNIENCDFKTAFLLLGGNYGNSFSDRLRIDRAKREQQIRQQKEQEKIQDRKINIIMIDYLRNQIEKTVPFTDYWCECTNLLQKELLKLEERM